MKNEIEYYNQKEFWEGYIDNENEIKRAKQTIDAIPHDIKSVLDIGCGNGIVSNMIQNELTISMDLAIFPLKQVKNDAVCASIDAIPFKAGTFDLILTTEVLEHLTDPVYKKAISEIKRINPKYILITVPFNENLERDMCICKNCRCIFHAYHHYRNFREKWYTGDFPEYDVVSVQYMSYRISLNESISRLKHYFGIYSSNKNAMCPKCGGVSRSAGILKYPFSVMDSLEYRMKKILNFYKPYHQLILLSRKSEF